MTPQPEPNRHPQTESELDNLSRLLDSWQPASELSAGFEARLRSRIEVENAAPASWWSFAPVRWAGAMATVVLLAAIGLFSFRPNHAVKSSPAPAPIVQMAQNELPATAVASDALTRDLQALNSDQDLINHLDFLSTPEAGATPAPQERD